VKELSERSEAKWKKRIIEGGIKGFKIGQSPFHSWLGCAGFFLMRESQYFWTTEKVDLLN